MRQNAEYWEAYRRWLELKAMDIDAEHRLTREEAHERITAKTSDQPHPQVQGLSAEQ